MNSIERHLAELSLTISARLEDIKKAYRDKAKQAHPDRCHGDKTKEGEAVKRMQKLNAAYEVLKHKFSQTGCYMADCVRMRGPVDPGASFLFKSEFKWRPSTEPEAGVTSRSRKVAVNFAAAAFGLAAGIIVCTPVIKDRFASPVPAVSATERTHGPGGDTKLNKAVQHTTSGQKNQQLQRGGIGRK